MVFLAELKRQSASSGVDVATQEKDYAISWLLKGLFENEALNKDLIFKGGTALRKVYFEDFRFSQDLDFTLAKSWKEDELSKIVSSICDDSYRNSGIEFSMVSLEQTSKELGKEAYEVKVSFIGPRQHRGNPARVKLDLTCYEKLILPPASLPLIHLYSDECKVKILAYQLEEIVAEKLRSILQRMQPRDFYDVWKVLRFYDDRIQVKKIVEVFFEKCNYKNVEPREWDKCLQSEEVLALSKNFQASLRR